MDRAVTALKFRAVAVAMALKSDQLDPEDLDKLRQQARPLEHRPEARAIEGFCAQVLDAAKDRDRLRALACDLLAYIEAVNMPDPPGAERSDLHG